MNTVEQFSVRTIVFAADCGFMQHDPALKRGFRGPEIKAVHPRITFDDEFFSLPIIEVVPEKPAKRMPLQLVFGNPGNGFAGRRLENQPGFGQTVLRMQVSD